MTLPFIPSLATKLHLKWNIEWIKLMVSSSYITAIYRLNRVSGWPLETKGLRRLNDGAAAWGRMSRKTFAKQKSHLSILHAATGSLWRNEPPPLHRLHVCSCLKLPDSLEIKYDDGQGQRQRKLRQIEEEVMIKSLRDGVWAWHWHGVFKCHGAYVLPGFMGFWWLPLSLCHFLSPPALCHLLQSALPAL